MSRDKQIEEMARDIRIAETEYMVAMVTADIDDAIDGAAPRNERLATALYEKGYRKQNIAAWERVRKLPDGTYSHFCTKCSAFYRHANPIGYDYCPWCGAKIDHTRGTDLRPFLSDCDAKKKYESEGADDDTD